MNTTVSQCPNCQAPSHDGDVFCEQCGARLAEDEPVAGEQDRIELDLVVAAAVSDRGRVHRRNEDSFFLEVADGRSVAAVVCDGISSASAGNAAARHAATTAGAVLSDALVNSERDANTVMVNAIQAAGGAVEQVPWTTRTGRVDPSCTLVSALRRVRRPLYACEALSSGPRYASVSTIIPATRAPLRLGTTNLFPKRSRATSSTSERV